jgi:hypothetical protein
MSEQRTRSVAARAKAMGEAQTRRRGQPPILSTTAKLVYVISRLLLFSKSALRLILKIKATLFET